VCSVCWQEDWQRGSVQCARAQVQVVVGSGSARAGGRCGVEGGVGGGRHRPNLQQAPCPEPRNYTAKVVCYRYARSRNRVIGQVSKGWECTEGRLARGGAAPPPRPKAIKPEKAYGCWAGWKGMATCHCLSSMSVSAQRYFLDEEDHYHGGCRHEECARPTVGVAHHAAARKTAPRVRPKPCLPTCRGR